jgi:hypothetical protein
MAEIVQEMSKNFKIVPKQLYFVFVSLWFFLFVFFSWPQKNYARKIFQIMSLEGFFKRSQKDFSDHVKKGFFQIMPERFLRSCQEGFFKLCQKHFSDRVKKGFSNHAREIFSDHVKKGFFQIMPERFFRSSQRRGFQIVPERFFRSSEESSNKLVKSADIMCMMEQILES